MTRYEHTINGRYNETIAILADGREMVINIQYGTIHPLGKHGSTCEQETRMGGVCNCGLLDGVDVAALVADAREHGKLGPAPVVKRKTGKTIKLDRTGVCPKCGTYCDGDCEA